MHALHSVTYVSDTDARHVVRCKCGWQSYPEAAGIGEMEYERHVRLHGEELGPVPWRDPVPVDLEIPDTYQQL